MKRLNRNMRARDAALEKAPIVLKPICAYAAIHVRDRMIYNLVRVITSESFMESRASE